MVVKKPRGGGGGRAFNPVMVTLGFSFSVTTMSKEGCKERNEEKDSGSSLKIAASFALSPRQSRVSSRRTASR